MGTRFCTTGPVGPQLGPLDAANLREQFNALRDDVLKIVAGNYLLTTAGIGTGTTVDRVAHLAFSYVIAGIQYQKTAEPAGVTCTADTIPEDLYGAMAFEIAADGTVDPISAAANATGYATPALALAGIPAVAAGHVRLGTVTVMNSDAAYVFDTDSFAGATVTEVYASEPVFGLDASMTAEDLTAD